MSIDFRHAWRTGRMILAAMLLPMSLSLAHAEDAAPPGRVARLNHLDGTVTFSPAGTDDWSIAAPNRPLTIGDRVWADKGARSELHVGSTAMRLGPSTSLELLDLGDDDAQFKVTQGTFSIRVRDLDRDENVEIDTPNLAFVIREPGEYRFDVDPDRDTTTVTVRRGAGQAYGSSQDNRPVSMKTNRQLTFSGTDLFYSYSGDAPPRDAFDRWAAERDDRENNARSVRYVSRDMTGYEELDDNGEWREVRDYGPVWVPRVTVRNWAPYHYGHWAWIAPWGWTWVDDERWGFAPFHYGRWARIDDYWAWVPGPIARRPVYAPALVGFVSGGSNGTHWGVSLSIGTPGVAWFALAPGEHYRPAYTSNPTYINNINRTVIINRTVVHNTYINQRVPHAIAAMPASDFVRGRPAHERRREVHEDRLRDFARMPSASSLPVAPVRRSLSGAAPSSRAAPPERRRDHEVVARRQPPEAPAFRDELARKFAAQRGTVPGAGPVFTPVARPARDNPEGSRNNTGESRRASDDRSRPDAEERNGRTAARPDGIPPPNAATTAREEGSRDRTRQEVPPPPSRREAGVPTDSQQEQRNGQGRTVQAPTRRDDGGDAGDGRRERSARETTAEIPRPGVTEPRRDSRPEPRGDNARREPRQESQQTAQDRQNVPVDVPRPPVIEPRTSPGERNDNRIRDRIRNDRNIDTPPPASRQESQQATQDRQNIPVDVPRPPVIEPRTGRGDMNDNRIRDRIRNDRNVDAQPPVSRQEPTPTQQPRTEQVPRQERRIETPQERQPERPAVIERRIERQVEQREVRASEERRVEPARPQRVEAERNERGNQRMMERPAERPAERPPQQAAAQRDERPQRGPEERRDRGRGEQRQ